MSILYRYLIKEVLKHFVFVLSAVTVVYLAIDFFENIDRFMEAGLPISRSLRFFQLKLPLILVQVTPLGVLLAILITLGLMNKNNEIIVLKSSGMSVYHLLKPILTLGLAFTILYFILAEVVVPITISKAKISELEDCLEIGGLYKQKSKRLKKIAQTIVEDFGGDLEFLGDLPVEEARKFLLNFEGVGEKTADVLLSFYFDKPKIALDTHVFRVAKRLGYGGKGSKYSEISTPTPPGGQRFPVGKAFPLKSIFWPVRAPCSRSE